MRLIGRGAVLAQLGTLDKSLDVEYCSGTGTLEYRPCLQPKSVAKDLMDAIDAVEAQWDRRPSLIKMDSACFLMLYQETMSLRELPGLSGIVGSFMGIQVEVV